MTYIIPFLLAGLLALAVLIVLVLAARRPNEFSVARSISVSVPPPAVFGLVNNLRLWEGWSPWEKLDPNMKRDYSGPNAGVGASYAWSGTKKVGEGKSTIIESRPHNLIVLNLEFVRPFACQNRVEFSFTPEKNGARVTWTMLGKNNFFAKVFGLFMNLDKMIGADFEKGLAQLKSLAEAAAKP